MVLTLRRKQKRIFFDKDLEGGDSGTSRRVIDWYVRESIAAFEAEEADKLSEVPFISRRVSVAADTQLGTLPPEDVIIQYEAIVPGAVDRIMGLASERLKVDSEAKISLFRRLCRQGFRGMVAGFILTLLLAVGALLLLFFEVLWAGALLLGVNFALGACATAYISLGGLRERWFTGEFFPRIFYPRYRYDLGITYRNGRPSL